MKARNRSNHATRLAFQRQLRLLYASIQLFPLWKGVPPRRTIPFCTQKLPIALLVHGLPLVVFPADGLNRSSLLCLFTGRAVSILAKQHPLLLCYGSWISPMSHLDERGEKGRNVRFAAKYEIMF